jgi:integrase/recombinase XerD
LAEAWILEHESTSEKFSQQASYVARFALSIGSTLALEVTKQQLLSWLREKKPGIKRKKGRGPDRTWSKTTQNDAASAVRRVYRWAVAEGKLSRNPLANLRVPKGNSRVVTVTPSEHAALVADARKHNPPLALYLIASRCGARPRQIREATPENVFILADGRMLWVFGDHKTAEKTGKPLVVHCYPCLATITKILMSSTRKFLFVNRDGKQWTKDAIVRAVRRVRERTGIDKPITAYAYRHSFATDALLAGASLAVVAELLGHVDTRMVGRVYGHLDQHRGHLLNAVDEIAKKRIVPKQTDAG